MSVRLPRYCRLISITSPTTVTSSFPKAKSHRQLFPLPSSALGECLYDNLGYLNRINLHFAAVSIESIPNVLQLLRQILIAAPSCFRRSSCPVFRALAITQSLRCNATAALSWPKRAEHPRISQTLEFAICLFFSHIVIELSSLDRGGNTLVLSLGNVT